MNEVIKQLAEQVDQAGGVVYLVGGSVRDELLGRNCKDFDCEVFGLTQDQLETILAQFGKVDLVGKSFGVYKIGDLDISLPRTERKTGEGHKGFTINADPFMSVQDAMRRRDFTINAIYQNVLTGEIVDHFGGVKDLSNKVLRIVDKTTFVDDSLRVLRAAQFASRFGFDVADDYFMQSIDLSDLPAERVFGELEKLLLGDYVEHGLEVLDAVGAVKQLFPELYVLRHVEQDAYWHPEGWSLTELPSSSFRTGMTSTESVNLSVRELLLSAVTNLAGLPASGSTNTAESVNTVASSGQTTNGTRVDSGQTPSTSSVASLTQSKGFVWNCGVTLPANKVIRVMFEIPQSRMQSVMGASIDDFQVINNIVSPVSVFMMDVLGAEKRSVKGNGHNMTVQPDTAFSLDTGFNVTSFSADFGTNSVNDNVIFTVEGFISDDYSIHNDYYTSDKVTYQVTIGDVWTHTKMVMNVANSIAKDLPKPERLTVMLACLFHDLGKATTTEHVDGRVRAHGHSEAGVPLAEAVLNRLRVHTINGFDVRNNVLQLVDKHLIPAQWHRDADIKDSAFRRLSTKVNVKLLAYVSRADVLGRGGDDVNADCVDYFQSRIDNLDLSENTIKPILQGRHLIELGMTPSKEFGTILAAVFEKQLDGSVTNLEEALREVSLP